MTDGSEMFDPAFHGFGFRNPVGVVPGRKGVFRRLDPFLYGNGLCFGMSVASLCGFSEGRRLSKLELSPELLNELFTLHARQYRPKAVFAVVREWARSGGGRPDRVPGRLRLPESGDPHILCFGPRMNRSFVRCMRRAHAVAPYRVESLSDEVLVYVYDPNYPGDRGRRVSFGRDGGFQYGAFSSDHGWGITLLPISAIGEPPI